MSKHFYSNKWVDDEKMTDIIAWLLVPVVFGGIVIGINYFGVHKASRHKSIGPGCIDESPHTQFLEIVSPDSLAGNRTSGQQSCTEQTSYQG